jgi:hypothetical protein
MLPIIIQILYQIIPVAVSLATGYSSKFINAGDIENKSNCPYLERLLGTEIFLGT